MKDSSSLNSGLYVHFGSKLEDSVDMFRCQNTRRQDLMGIPALRLHKGGYSLCADHFEDSQFTCPAERNRLTHSAVPTLFQVQVPT